MQAVGPMARVAMRVRADVILVSPLGGRRLPSRRGDASVRVHGEPIELLLWVSGRDRAARVRVHGDQAGLTALRDRKSTRLNSSHVAISYAVFCLKKKTVI